MVYKNGKQRLKSLAIMDGYDLVTINTDGKCKTWLVHRLVGTLFVENPNGYSCIDHIDTNPSNNCATNLKWVKDLAENMQNPITVAKRINNVRIKQYDKDTNEFIQEWPDAYTVAKQLGYQSSNVLSCCRGKLKTAYGYRWKFVDEK